jgi:NADH dehydrogenase
MSRIFITGGSGFVGTAVIEELLAQNWQVRALSHGRKLQVADDRVQSYEADLFDPDALARGISGCDAVIHLVGIIMESPAKGITFQRMHFDATKCIVDATMRAGIKRYIHMSALGTRPHAVSNYHKTKFAAEEYVRATSLDWTIIRPSMIHGPRGEFMKMEAAWARGKAPPFLFMPYFGGKHSGMLQPVDVRDVARAFVDSLSNSRTIGEIYPIGGTERLRMPQLHRAVAQAVIGKPRAVGSMPVWFANILIATGIAQLVGFNRDQLIMCQENNTCDLTKFEQHFNFEPRAFEASMREYAKEL